MTFPVSADRKCDKPELSVVMTELELIKSSVIAEESAEKSPTSFGKVVIDRIGALEGVIFTQA